MKKQIFFVFIFSFILGYIFASFIIYLMKGIILFKGSLEDLELIKETTFLGSLSPFWPMNPMIEYFIIQGKKF